ncbi:MAG TPA: CdaR family protein [Chloroflexota bacterium]|nr:CdaR family protein [Chloroflexota bacterium]
MIVPGSVIRAAIALVLGFATWMVVTWEQNPFREDWLGQTVPVEVTHLPTGMVEVGKLGQVRVRLRASQDSWSTVKPADFKASVDLSRQSSGIHSMDVKVETSGEYQVVDWDPKKVTVRLEPLAQATVPVQLQVTGSLPDGYVLRSQTVTPDQVSVTGQQDLVQTITEAAVMTNLGGMNSNIAQDVTPTLLDEKGQPIAGVQFSPSTVRVSLEIDHQIGAKTVPIRVATTGQVALGYWLSSLAVSPQTVTITGGPAALGKVDFIDLPPLDLSGAKANVSRSTKLTAGNGYSLVSDGSVDVKAVIQPLRTTEVLPIGIAVQGVPQGLEAKLSPPTVEVTISGLVPALSALKPGDVSAVVSAQGLATGSHTLLVRLNAPGSVSLDATNPPQVTVALAPPATVTPTTTPGPSPAAAAASSTPAPGSTSTPATTGTPAASASVPTSGSPAASTTPAPSPSR